MVVNKFIRNLAKRNLGRLIGNFKYFNTKVFFPKNSLIFRIACTEGIYDKEVLNFIFTYIKENSLLIDVGTNIGLTSIPILKNYNNTHVISFEPSRSVFPFLKKTHLSSGLTDRWSIYDKALGNTIGTVGFKRNREMIAHLMLFRFQKIRLTEDMMRLR
ncbi:FkbM family methyltransferase [Pedobacter agri]|uniref:FkbM family methyltransferase n=1 Tax=Pedobacter agri TaxID=454586 RepID=UPI00292E56AF|nr:FkbM family methyltransferase [Pedobacter agri]